MRVQFARLKSSGPIEQFWKLADGQADFGAPLSIINVFW